MQNNYVLVGPKQNFSLLKNNISLINFLKKIHKEELNFISRGDNSGTHKKERELWNLVNINTNSDLDWYLSVGQGMGQTLLIANNYKGYTLSDRSTWLSFNTKDNLKTLQSSLYRKA